MDAVAPAAPLGQVAAPSGAAIRRPARPGRFARSPDAWTRRPSRARDAALPDRAGRHGGMRVVRAARLHLRDATSDKVYDNNLSLTN